MNKGLKGNMGYVPGGSVADRLEKNGPPKLADLGAAKFMDEAHKTTETATGMINGSP